VLRFAGETFVLTRVDGHPTFQRGVPGIDADGDGVPYAQDAFPFDPAASQDGDRDGYPDAWNPGYGPDDSTTGLALDAFPLDAACQLEEHGVDGVCDSVAVLPASGQPFCDSDELLSEDANGAMYAPRADDFEPLCSGWLLLADRIESRIAVHNVVNGRSAARFPLPGAPGELELDEANQQLYVAFPEHYALGRLDLVTGAVETIQLADAPTSLSLGPAGGLFVATAPNANTRLLYWLPAGAGAVTGGWPIVGSQLRWNPAHDELLVADGEQSHARLARYDFEPVSGPSLLESRIAGSYGRRLALSPDGEHLAYAAFGGNGPDHEEPFDQGIFDFVANDLTSHRGAFAIVHPSNAAFAPDGARLLAASKDEAVIFGVGDFAPELVQGLAGGNEQSVGWSRGGALAFVRERFSFPTNRDYYRWIVSPAP
jgi:hypothetical protein